MARINNVVASFRAVAQRTSSDLLVHTFRTTGSQNCYLKHVWWLPHAERLVR
jgi:hypothetical protein